MMIRFLRRLIAVALEKIFVEFEAQFQIRPFAAVTVAGQVRIKTVEIYLLRRILIDFQAIALSSVPAM